MDDSKQSVAVFDPDEDIPAKPKRRWLRSIVWSVTHLLVGMGLSAGLLYWWQSQHLAQTDEPEATTELTTHHDDTKHGREQPATNASNSHGQNGASDEEVGLDEDGVVANSSNHEPPDEDAKNDVDKIDDVDAHPEKSGDLSRELLGQAVKDSGTKEPSHAQLLNNADVEYVAGNIEEALKLYNNLLGEATRIPAENLLYRRALCFEGMDEKDQALQEYQRLAKSEINEALVAACVVGQARIFASMNRLDAARASLYSQVFVLAKEPRALSHVMHQLTYLATMEAIDGLDVSTHDSRLIGMKTILSPKYVAENEDLLRLSQTSASEKLNKAVDAVEAGVHLLKRIGEGSQEIHLSVRIQEQSIPSLLDEISVAAGIPLLVDETVRNLLAKRTVSATVIELDLATLLDCVLEPSGISWSIEDGHIRIWALHDLTREELNRERRERADRHGKSALTFFPDDQQAAMTFLCLGNIQFWQDEFADAIRWYRRAEGPGKVGPWLAAAWFNHAKCHLLLGQREEAREAFFRTADLSRRKELESVSYAFLGRLYLDDGHVDEAIRELNRALQGTSAIPEAAITLAAAYLLIENPETANMILYKYRDQVQASGFDTQAMVVSSLAKLQASTSEATKIRQGRELASALAAAEPQRFFSAVGYLIVGRGYEQIGQPGEMETVFEAAVRDLPPCMLRDQMAYLLGNYMVEEHRWDEAEALFEPLAKSERPSEWSRKSQLALAELAFERGDFDRCLQVCYDLIGDTEALQEKERLLRLMGQSYERKLDHYRAAICFAGMIPVNATSDVQPSRD